MKKQQKAVVTWGVIIVVLVGGFFLLRGGGDESKIELAKCLTDKGAKFYGASWCPHCANQKTLFGAAGKYVPYIECADPANANQQTAVCEDAGIESYPTWVFADGSRKSGVVPLEVLASKAGCE